MNLVIIEVDVDDDFDINILSAFSMTKAYDNITRDNNYELIAYRTRESNLDKIIDEIKTYLSSIRGVNSFILIHVEIELGFNVKLIAQVNVVDHRIYFYIGHLTSLGPISDLDKTKNTVKRISADKSEIWIGGSMSDVVTALIAKNRRLTATMNEVI